jgi:hypothetical protein
MGLAPKKAFKSKGPEGNIFFGQTKAKKAFSFW